MTETVRVFVAATPSEWLPQRVLEFSIRETTSLELEVRALYTFQRSYALPKDVKNRPRTPFSFQRFLIPEVCGYQGKAIYLDADMQVFQDINQLWSTPMRGCDVQTVSEGKMGRRGQFSVMLLNCAELDWNVDAIVNSLDSGELSYEQLMHEMRVARQIGFDIAPTWNSLEHYDAGQTALVHYTDMNTQPWVSRDNVLEPVWVNCLLRAVKLGFISIDEVRQEVASGHIRPSLLLQVERGVPSSRTISSEAKRLDDGFVAPYRVLECSKSRPWTSPYAFLKSIARTKFSRWRTQRTRN